MSNQPGAVDAEHVAEHQFRIEAGGRDVGFAQLMGRVGEPLFNSHDKLSRIVSATEDGDDEASMSVAFIE